MFSVQFITFGTCLLKDQIFYRNINRVKNELNDENEI